MSEIGTPARLLESDRACGGAVDVAGASLDCICVLLDVYSHACAAARERP